MQTMSGNGVTVELTEDRAIMFRMEGGPYLLDESGERVALADFQARSQQDVDDRRAEVHRIMSSMRGDRLRTVS
jgi:hypothetical protein